MGVTRRRVGALAILTALTFAVPLSGLLYPTCAALSARTQTPYDIAVVLGADVTKRGDPDGPSTARIHAGVALLEAGTVGRLHLSGGGGAARSMRRAAKDLGVPDDLIRIEDMSWSTLQNALFSRDMLDPDASLLLVTEGFHLSRSWASFWWADRAPTAACRPWGYVNPGPEASRSAVLWTLREGLVTWVNLARATVWSALQATGVAPGWRDDILR